ncbi:MULTISPECIES: acyl-CoA carboxylase subunit epsilon [Nocardiopsidaceae]|uniref:Acyl-CoA carboxylase subunit epsilon n=2 Tax=Nocardiopsidaceae TaxID=83676 RepID=A0ABY6YPU1_9ACTN|nr:MULTISPECIES: acyl-CoA carboxylase subunit epsilon [Nocardiopsaceae]MEE2050351.1 acyl-CoA carboxylase subunit epsilon [Nocardiopsis umidischolae]WAE74378.1 acyl-CoA carboxylase subunit epsilon [Streptomonospora nanhaiensis]
MSAPKNPPHLVVVRGEPTAEEVAVLTAVLAARANAARAASDAPGEDRRPSGWGDRSRNMRAPLRPGPGAWRLSTR